MYSLADTHVHLLAGLDDGPADVGIAEAMCRMLVSEGAGHATALAHQNDTYPENTADCLRAAASSLRAQLAEKNIPLHVYPTGEIMLAPTIVDDWQAGRLLSVGDQKRWLLVEMPHGSFVDVLPIASTFRSMGIRLIIAHAERYEELLHEPQLTADWIAAGCLIQVTAQALAEPRNSEMERGLKQWVQGGFVHLLGSDGHGIDRRRPLLANGHRRLVEWVGTPAATRIGSLWGVAILQGLPVEVPPPKKPSRRWFTRLFGT